MGKGKTKAKSHERRRAGDDRGTGSRGTGSRGTENRLAPPAVFATPSRSLALWSVIGDSAIPDVLAHGLLKEKELVDAMLYEPELVPEKCADLYAAWEFLFAAQHRSERDPKDGALLVTDPMKALMSARKTETRSTGIGDETFLVVTEWGDPDYEVWQPRSFPRQTPEEIAVYPKRPKRVAQIPPFSAENVRAWREVLEGGQGMLVQKAPAKSEPTPRRPPAPDPKAAAEMLERAAEDARRRLIDVTVASVTAGDTPLVDQALTNLSLLTLDDIARQTKVPFPKDSGNLLEPVEAFFFHSSRTVVLDKKGEPTNLRGRLTYPILVAEPGHPMIRSIPSSGLYISVQRYGFSTFRIDGSRISKVLFGGVGGMQENHGGGVVTAHPLHVKIQEYLESRGRFVYVASITTEAGRKPRALTLDAIEERLPILARATLPFLVKQILARIPTKSEEVVALLEQVAIEAIKQLIIDEVRDRVIAFVVKKLGSRLVPLVNVVVALMDAFDDEQNARIRHALATAEMAVRAQTNEEITIAAKVMAEIVADEVADRVIAVLVGQIQKHAKKAIPGAAHGADGTPMAPDADGGDQGTSPAPRADAPGVDGAPAAQHAPPPADVPPAVDAPSAPDRPANVDAPAPAGAPPALDAPGAAKRPVGFMGTAPPDDDGRPRRTRQDDGEDDAPDRRRADVAKPDHDGKTGDPAIGDPATDDTATGSRIGTGERIGVSDRDPTPVDTGREALTRPGKRTSPSREGPMSIANAAIGEPLHTSIGGAEVNSRHKDVLVGARTDNHREDVLKVIANDPNHPMRPMLDDSGTSFRQPPYTHGDMDEWARHPYDWQSGHVRSNRARDGDTLVVQTRYRNQRSSADRERTGDVTMDRALVIGGIAVDERSARDLRDAGYIRMTEEELESQPMIYFDRDGGDDDLN